MESAARFIGNESVVANRQGCAPDADPPLARRSRRLQPDQVVVMRAAGLHQRWAASTKRLASRPGASPERDHSWSVLGSEDERAVASLRALVVCISAHGSS
jgi:hypothetical protein